MGGRSGTQSASARRTKATSAGVERFYRGVIETLVPFVPKAQNLPAETPAQSGDAEAIAVSDPPSPIDSTLDADSAPAEAQDGGANPNPDPGKEPYRARAPAPPLFDRISIYRT